MGKYKIFVDGSSTGLRIADRLAERDEFEILKISAADRKDVHARAAVINESDLSFLCLPDAMRPARSYNAVCARMCAFQTSTAHRTAPGWLYGLPELHGTREVLKPPPVWLCRVADATGFITPVAPLVELGILPKTAHLSVTSLTGYSGGGKKMIAEYEGERTNEALNAPRPYGLALHHKNRPETGGHHRAGNGPQLCAGRGGLLCGHGDHDPAGSDGTGRFGPAGRRRAGRVLCRAADDEEDPR